MRSKRINQQGRLSFRKIILGFLFLLIIFVGLSYFSSPKSPPSEEVRKEGNLVPSEVLKNKSTYNGEEIVIRGKVSPAPVVCKQGDCPADDSCCGCPDERDLLIVDSGVILVAKTKERLRLLDYGSQSFCRRLPSSCEYDCQGWLDGAIYDVEGIFFAEPPLAGWGLSLDQYFEVEGKNLVRKAGFQEVLENIFAEIKGMLKSLGGPSFYVLD